MVDTSELQFEYEEERQHMAPLQGDDADHTQDVEDDTSSGDATIADFPLFDNSQLKMSQQSCLELSPMYRYFETDSLPPATPDFSGIFANIFLESSQLLISGVPSQL